MKTWPSIRLPKSAVEPIKKGHPWIFRDFRLTEEPGTPVVLLDERSRPIAWGLADEGPIAIRVLGRGHPQEVGPMLIDRVLRADRVRQQLVPTNTDCYRIVNGAGDGLPGLIIDRYANLAVIRIYSKAWEAWIDWILKAIAGLGWSQLVYRRFGVDRVDGRKGGRLLVGSTLPDKLIVQENGIRQLVRPKVGQKTGMFLDQRAHRALIGQWAAGRQVVNLFAYTGGFSLSAAMGGAARVYTVDIAPEAIEDAKENFRLNGLSPEQHVFEVADAFKWLPPHPVDLFIVDPPALTRGKRSDHAAERAYQKLHKHIGGSVRRDGFLASSSCTARLDLARWRAAIASGLFQTGDWSWHWISGEPIDHPTALIHTEARYLKFALLRRRQ